jgi:hypothetical protein
MYLRGPMGVRAPKSARGRTAISARFGSVLIRMLSLRNLSVSASRRLVSTENLLTAESPRCRDYAEN